MLCWRWSCCRWCWLWRCCRGATGAGWTDRHDPIWCHLNSRCPITPRLVAFVFVFRAAAAKRKRRGRTENSVRRTRAAACGPPLPPCVSFFQLKLRQSWVTSALVRCWMRKRRRTGRQSDKPFSRIWAYKKTRGRVDKWLNWERAGTPKPRTESV